MEERRRCCASPGLPSTESDPVFVRFDTEAVLRIVDVGVVVSRSMEGLMERQHRRYSKLDWPTNEELMKAHRLRGKVLRDGVVVLVRALRAVVASISKPDVHRQTVPIPLVGGTKARGGAVGD
jgi:hypothetical protein